MEIVDHRLSTARFVPSPNFDARPDPRDISLLVIHGISLPPGQFGGGYVDALFCNSLDPAGHPYFAEICQLRVSSHVLIRRDGSMVQYVPFNLKAWHAGLSSFDGRDKCNDFSIGIELEGTDEVPYTQEQYAGLGQLSKLLMQAYPAIVPARIAGHADIAPGRKTDPGPAFDWEYYRQGLA